MIVSFWVIVRLVVAVYVVPLIDGEESVVSPPEGVIVNPVAPLAGRTGGDPVSVKLIVSVVPDALIDADATVGAVMSIPVYGDVVGLNVIPDDVGVMVREPATDVAPGTK